MIVRNDFIYLRLQKTGSMFIKDFLKTIGGKEIHSNIGDIGMSGHFGLENKPEGKFVFGGIRNPWDWYVSFWSMLLKDDKHNEEFLVDGRDFKSFMVYCLTKKTGRGLNINYDRMQELNVGLLSHEYYRIFGLNKVEPYHVDICEESLDGVYRMENMIDDFIGIFEKNVNTLSNGHRSFLLDALPVNKHDHDNYRSYYDDELIELVREKDKSIIDKYEYKF